MRTGFLFHCRSQVRNHKDSVIATTRLIQRRKNQKLTVKREIIIYMYIMDTLIIPLVWCLIRELCLFHCSDLWIRTWYSFFFHRKYQFLPIYQKNLNDWCPVSPERSFWYNLGSTALLKGETEEKQRPGAASLCVPVGDMKDKAVILQALPVLLELTWLRMWGWPKECPVPAGRTCSSYYSGGVR